MTVNYGYGCQLVIKLKLLVLFEEVSGKLVCEIHHKII